MVFVKGQSGNPGGRPKREWSWTQLLEEVGEMTEEKTGRKFRELVSKRLWVECANGNIVAIKELMNRMDGMPKQSMDLDAKGDFKIRIEDYGHNNKVPSKTKTGV